MSLTTPLFEATGIATTLANMPDAELDSLPLGVVEMDREGTVLRYNATEARHAGLPPARVVGRHFFRYVAPCSNNRHVAHRYQADTLDQTIAYSFSLRMKPVPVTLRMLKPAQGDRMYLLVLWP